SGSSHPFSVNGWYSSQNSFSSPSNPCPAFPVPSNPNFSQALFYGGVPGIDVFFNAVNNKNQIVAFAASSQGAVSIVGEVNPVDFSLNFIESVQVPGTPYASFATGINDAGQVVGISPDSAQNIHGFLLDHGVYTAIDFPGAVATEAL